MTLDTDRFLQDLALQRERYEAMVEVAREQNRAISSADMDALLEILRRKGELLAEVDEIEKRTAPAREAWNAERESLDAGTRKRVEEAVERTREVLRKLLALEEEGAAMMKGRKGAAGDRLKEIQKKKRMLDAYGKGGPPQSRFIDERQ